MNEHCVMNDVNGSASPNLYLSAGTTDPNSHLDLVNPSELNTLQALTHNIYASDTFIYTHAFDSNNNNAVNIRRIMEARFKRKNNLRRLRNSSIYLI